MFKAARKTEEQWQICSKLANDSNFHEFSGD